MVHERELIFSSGYQNQSLWDVCTIGLWMYAPSDFVAAGVIVLHKHICWNNVVIIDVIGVISKTFLST